ncbi:MAG: PKD domain-containing protein [Bacteroidota bacterium]
MKSILKLISFSLFLLISSNINAQPVCVLGVVSADSFSVAQNIGYNQDYCTTTSSYYTVDMPSNLCGSCSLFGGSIENNSWFKFVAQSNTINFWGTILNCSSGTSAQFAFYRYDTSGLTLLSNIAYSNSVATSSITDSLTNLTIGETIYLMIDGNSGSVCDFSIRLMLPNAATTIDLGQNKQICKGDSIIINSGALLGSNNTWYSVPNDPNLANYDSTSQSINVSPDTTTMYFLQSKYNGIETVDSMVLTILEPPALVASNDVTICNGSCTTISCSGIYYYSWNNAGTLSNPNSASPTACPTTTTTYIINATSITNGCTASDDVIVNVNQPISVQIIPTISTACVNNAIQVTTSSSGCTAAYSWSNGTTTQNTTFYALPDSTNINLTVTDCNGCLINATLYIPTSPQPNAQFTYYLDSTINSPNVYHFQAVNSTYNNSFHWDFGDGSSSNDSTPFHQYTDTGSYNVVLIVTNAEGCSDTTNQSVNINNSVPLYTLGGQVFGQIYPIDLGKAYIYKKLFDEISELDSTFIDTLGYFYFPHILAGEYVVKAELNNNSSLFGQYLPTYYFSSLAWNSASSISLTQNKWDADIHLQELTLSSGNGNISGKVVQVAKETFDMKKINIFLIGSSSQTRTYIKPDINGNFSFNNIAYDNYQLFADYTGKISMPITLTLDENNPNASNIILEVQDKTISAINDNNAEKANAIGFIYPNPAANQISIPFNLGTCMGFDIKIYNIAMQELMNSQIFVPSGENKHIINIDKLQAGTYFVKIISKDFSLQKTCRLVIVR